MEPSTSRIIRIDQAPLPTPDPWGIDPPGFDRCPKCALLDPGPHTCRRCRAKLTVQLKAKRRLTANLFNLCIVLAGCRPMLLVIAVLFRDPSRPFLSPFLFYLLATIPVAVGAAAGLTMRWRWAWFVAIFFSFIDGAAQIFFQIQYPQNPIIALAGVLLDLIMIGLLLTVYDDVRIDTARLSLPEDDNMPRTAIDAFNRGVELSRDGYWYFAARMWQRAVAFQHHEPRFRRALGMAYVRLHEYEAAAGELNAAYQLAPDDLKTRELLSTLAQKRSASKIAP